MYLADVNVLVYAHRAESDRHDEYRLWLEERLSGVEPFGIAHEVLASLVRIVTNPRIYRTPSTTGEALDFCAAVLDAPAAILLRPGPGRWSIFADLCSTQRLCGNDIPGAFLAALAIDSGSTLVTADRGFGRFPGLRFVHPLDGSGG